MGMASVTQHIYRENKFNAILAIEISCINYLAVVTRQSTSMASTVSTTSPLPAMHNVPCY